MELHLKTAEEQEQELAAQRLQAIQRGNQARAEVAQKQALQNSKIWKAVKDNKAAADWDYGWIGPKYHPFMKPPPGKPPKSQHHPGPASASFYIKPGLKSDRGGAGYVEGGD